MEDTDFSIVEDKDFKVFEFESNVFHLDDEEYLRLKAGFSGCKVTTNNPRPVLNDSGKVIGTVNLDIQGSTLVGHFFLDYSTPERLNIEANEVPLYPHLSFRGIFVRAPEMDRCEAMEIDSVTLSINPTKDYRISSVKA